MGSQRRGFFLHFLGIFLLSLFAQTVSASAIQLSCQRDVLYELGLEAEIDDLQRILRLDLPEFQEGHANRAWKRVAEELLLVYRGRFGKIPTALLNGIQIKQLVWGIGVILEKAPHLESEVGKALKNIRSYLKGNLGGKFDRSSFQGYVNEFRAAAHYLMKGYKIIGFREHFNIQTRDVYEIDLVLEDPADPSRSIFVEVKSSYTYDSRYARALHRLTYLLSAAHDVGKHRISQIWIFFASGLDSRGMEDFSNHWPHLRAETFSR